MARLVWSDAARDELAAILDYITRRSGDSTAGRAFVARIQQHCRKLASFDGVIGRARPELGAGLRTAPIGNYIIVFRYIDGPFLVTNVIERHRDIGDALGGDEDD